MKVKFIKLSKWFIILLISSIILIEIILRLFFSTKLRKWKQPNYIEDALIGWRYTPDYEGVKINNAFRNRYRTNSKGFNGAEFFNEKKEDVFRIMFVGTSDYTGIETNGPNSFVSLLSEKFKSYSDKIEIINCSIDGQNRSFKNLLFVKKYFKKYNPNLVFLESDIPLRNIKIFRTSYKGYRIDYDTKKNLKLIKNQIDNNFFKKNFFKPLFDISYIYRYLCKYSIENQTKFSKKIQKVLFNEDYKMAIGYSRGFFQAYNIGTAKETISIENSFKLIEGLKLKMQNEGVPLFLLNVYKNDINTLQKNLLNSREINNIDLDLFRKSSFYFGKINGHTTQEGHNVIANKLFDSIISNRIIPEKYFQEKKAILKTKYSNRNFDKLAKKNDTPKLKKMEVLNQGNIQLLINKKEASGIIEELNSRLKRNRNNISINISDILKPLSTEELTKAIYTIVKGKKANLILCEFPNDIDKIIEDNPEKLNSLIELNNKLNQQDIDLFLFDKKYNFYKSPYYKLFLLDKGIKYFNSNIEFSHWLIKDKGIDFIKDLKDKLIAEHIDNIISKEFISKRISNPYLNLALNKKVSSTESIEKWSWGEKYINDGKCYKTFKSKGWATKVKTPQDFSKEIIFDLENVHTIDNIVVYPKNDELKTKWMHFPIHFNFSFSKDSIKWENKKDIKLDRLPKEDDYLQIDFDNIESRFVRLESTKLVDKEWQVNFTEIEVYGK